MARQGRPVGWQTGLYTIDEIGEALAFSQEQPRARLRDPSAPIEDTEAVCFICKTPLFRSQVPNVGNYTREDVFPRWLVRHFELQTSAVDYPGAAAKQYPELLVPCCQPCNNEGMSAVERRISVAVNAPDQYAAFRQLSRSDLALWAIKIMYGLLYSRIAPWNFDTHKPRPPEIADEVLDHFRLSLMLLEGFRKRVVITGAPFPNSVLVLPIKPGAVGPPAFDYMDSTQFPTAIAMRIGSVGFISTFEDFGTVENWFDIEFASLIGDNALHPIQFQEIAARAFELAASGVHDVAYSAINGPRDVMLSLRPHLAHHEPVNHPRLHARIAAMTGDEEFVNYPIGATRIVGKSGTFLDLPWPPATKPEQ